MIGMFVREENAVKILGRATDRSEAFADLAAGKAGVDQQPGFAGFKIGAIAAGTAAKNRELNCHWRTSVGNRSRPGKWIRFVRKKIPKHQRFPAVVTRLYADGRE